MLNQELIGRATRDSEEFVGVTASREKVTIKTNCDAKKTKNLYMFIPLMESQQVYSSS